MTREFLLCLSLLLVVFAVSVWTPFAHHDQYRYFSEDYGDPTFKQHCYNDSQNGSLRTLGRPLAAKLECTVFFHTHRLRDLSYFRAVALLLLALTATILARFFQRLGVDSWLARLLAVALMALPGGQNAIFMANLPNVFTPLLAISGGILAVRGFGFRNHFAAWLLVGVAFFVYSPMILNFFVPLVAVLLLEQNSRESVWRPAARSVAVFLAAAAVFFVFGRRKYLANPAAMPEAYQLKLSPELIPDNLPRFFETVLPMELRAWDVYGELFGPFMLGLGLLVLLLPSERRRGAVPLALAVFVGANVLFLCTKAFVLYRVAWAAMSMLVLLGFAPLLIESRPWLRRLGGGALSLGLLLAAYNNFRNVENSRLEFAALKAQVAALPNDVRRIHVVMPEHTKGFNGMPAVLGDEYNVPSSSFNPGFIMEMVRLAYIELGREGVFIAAAEGGPRLERMAEVELRAKDETEFALIHDGAEHGVLRLGTRPKILPWEARAEGPITAGSLNFFKLGRWRSIDSNRWRIEGVGPLIYVSAARAEAQRPPEAHVLDLARHISN